MKIAIIYASKHGTTEKVAGSIAEKLSETNDVKLFSLKENPNSDIREFETVILGSSVYAGQASGRMKSFCKTNESVLLEKKTGLFVCGMQPDKEQQKKELKDAYSDVLLEKAVVTGFLGGEFLFEKLNFFERLIVKKIAKTKSSVYMIDWEAIDEFVKKIQTKNIKI
jgi:menaquinone-dependent protoporphyrinogen oxidase